MFKQNSCANQDTKIYRAVVSIFILGKKKNERILFSLTDFFEEQFHLFWKKQ